MRKSSESFVWTLAFQCGPDTTQKGVFHTFDGLAPRHPHTHRRWCSNEISSNFSDAKSSDSPLHSPPSTLAPVVIMSTRFTIAFGRPLFGQHAICHPLCPGELQRQRQQANKLSTGTYFFLSLDKFSSPSSIVEPVAGGCDVTRVDLRAGEFNVLWRLEPACRVHCAGEPVVSAGCQHCTRFHSERGPIGWAVAHW